jgi:4'-phosphopantetheinyl transferase
MAGGDAIASRALPRRAVLLPGEVHVWYATTDPELPPPPLPPVLSPSERRRAEAYRFDRDRRRFLLARTFLRLLLSAYVDASPAELEFDTTCRFCGGSHGKPRLAGSVRDPDFSLSYAGNAFLLAISAAGSVGADVEAVPSLASLDDLAAASASPGEAEAMRTMDEERRRGALARLWTLKEAILKATGHGLAIDPRALELGGLESAPRLLGAPRECGSPARWYLRPIDLGCSHAAALALPRAPAAVETWRLRGLSPKEQEFSST